jgi:hypothetical protein
MNPLEFFPSSYGIGRVMREMCLTRPERLSQDPNSLLTNVRGRFETALQQEIDDWRKKSFNHYLVDVQIWPQSSYEPSYNTTIDFSKGIKFFNVISGSGLLFPGVTLQPFRIIWGSSLQTRINGTWVPVKDWLESWLEITESTIYEPIQDYFARYCQFAGIRNLLSSLPLEIRWMIYDGLIEDTGFLESPEIYERGLSKPTRPQLNPLMYPMIPSAWFACISEKLCKEWELARDFTQYLLRNAVINFEFSASLCSFVSNAPMHALYYVRHIRLSFTTGSRHIYDSLGAPGCRSTPDWTLAALAYLPLLKEIELFIDPNPWAYCYDSHRPFVNSEDGCRTACVNLFVEAIFPWIALRAVDVKFTGAIRSSQKARFRNLLSQAQEQIIKEPPKLQLTELIRTQIRKARAKYDSLRPKHSRIRNPRNEEEQWYYDERMKAFRAARADFEILCWAWVAGVVRYHVQGNSITLKRPSRRRVDIPTYDRASVCQCYPPCIVNYERNPDLFFDDTDEGISRYLEWQELATLETG